MMPDMLMRSACIGVAGEAEAGSGRWLILKGSHGPLHFGLPAPQLDVVANASWTASSSGTMVSCDS